MWQFAYWRFVSLALMAACLSVPSLMRADVGKDPSLSTDAQPYDVVSLIRLGMTYKEVDSRLGEGPFCVGGGPTVVSTAIYKAGVIVTFDGNDRVIAIKRLKATRTRK